MKKVSIFLAVCAFCVSLHAEQFVADGYYRMQNVYTERYIKIVDDKAETLDMHTTDPDLEALMTERFSEASVSDPSMLMYIKYMFSNPDPDFDDQTFNIYAQGTDIETLLKSFGSLTQDLNGIRVKKVKGNFRAFQDIKGKMFLYDQSLKSFSSGLIKAGALQSSQSDFSRIDWKIIAVNPNDDSNYFGITPSVTVSDNSKNRHFYPLYFAFPFSFYSNGMKAYVVKQIDADNGICVIEELSGVIPGKTPVIIECSSTSANGNRLQLEPIDVKCTPVTANKLDGVMFNTPEVLGIEPGAYHYRKVEYNPNTMRVLGVTSEGKLGFVTAPAGLESIPANTSYLRGESLPAQLTLMTSGEYEMFLGVDPSKANAKKVAWTLGGTSIEVNSIDELPRGLYIVDGHKYIVQ